MLIKVNKYADSEFIFLIVVVIYKKMVNIQTNWDKLIILALVYS